MNRREEFCRLFARVYAGDEEGEAFHGPCTRAILTGIPAEIAAARPIAGGHTIWELVLHLLAWREFACDRLELRMANPDASLPPSGPEVDFPEPPRASEEAWKAALERLDANQARLLATIPRMDDAAFDERFASLRFLLHHDLYHGGQIGILRKAVP